MKKRTWIIPLGLTLALGSCIANAEDNASPPSQTAARPAPASTTTAVPATVSTSTETAPPRTGITVARVIDGDTFELADGRKVRVLGIDSCEMNTYGGEQAKNAAEAQLQNRYNEPITMTQEPGVDKDKYGRLLRYVQLDGDDFGEYMVQYDHTGVYQGQNDASEAYLASLYAADTRYSSSPPSGRECADPYAEYRNDVDVDVSHSGDGDDGESRFCRKRWWC